MAGVFDHLVPEAIRFVNAPTAARFSFIERDKIVPTPQFEHVQGRLQELYGHQRIIRPPNVAIVGPSGIGKSSAIDEFVRPRKGRRHRVSGQLKVPVLHMEYPPIPSPSWYAKTMARALGYAVALPHRYADMFDLIIERLELAEVRLIIIEEVNQLDGWPNVHFKEFYGLTRWISNRSQIPQALAGTEELLDIIDGDIQLVRRFERLELKPFPLDETFAGFVAAYIRTMPLKRPTEIGRSLIERVHEVGEGITDTTVKVLQRAAKRAILSGDERILLKHIEADSTLPPPVVARRAGRRGRRK